MNEQLHDKSPEFPERERLVVEILEAGTDILDRKLGLYNEDSGLVTDPAVTYRQSIIPVHGTYTGLGVVGPHPDTEAKIAMSVTYEHERLRLDVLSDGAIGKYQRMRTSAIANPNDWKFLPVSDEELRRLREHVIVAQYTAEPIQEMDDWEL